MELIGKSQKEEFFVKLREKCELNFKERKDIVLTKDQIIETVLELKIPTTLEDKILEIKAVIQKTKFGDIILN
jgi:phosphoenolpyruvate synthase/pyruvate phosphate dikinase